MLLNLEKFKNGHPAAKKDGTIVSFVAIIPGIHAPLIVDDYGVMENYFLDGRSGFNSSEDLELLDYPLTAEQHSRIYGERVG